MRDVRWSDRDHESFINPVSTVSEDTAISLHRGLIPANRSVQDSGFKLEFTSIMPVSPVKYITICVF